MILNKYTLSGYVHALANLRMRAMQLQEENKYNYQLTYDRAIEDVLAIINDQIKNYEKVFDGLKDKS